jgi:hypothetical protein
MADISGYGTTLPQGVGYVAQAQTPAPFVTNLTPAVTYYFQMQGTDAVTTATASWVVQGAPDIAAQFYTGGLTLPLRFVCVIASWAAPQ